MPSIAGLERAHLFPFLRREGGKRTGDADRGSWQACDSGQRQWDRIHFKRDPDLPDDRKIDWHYIAPGKPTQNAFIESSNGRLRDEFWNETCCHPEATLAPRCRLAHRHYNTERPQSRLGWQTPAAFALTFTPQLMSSMRAAARSILMIV